MKKLVTLTASALLMASMATAASAAETTTGTPAATTDSTATPATTVTPAAPAATTTNATADFVGNQNGFSFPVPAYWDSRVTNTELNAEQLKSQGQNGTYLVNFTYTPEFTTADGSKAPVTFASIRGYDRTVWDAITNKETLGTQLNETGGIVYVLEPVTANPFSNTTDMERFSNLLQNVKAGITSDFSTNVTPGTNTPGVPVNPEGPVVPNDPSKVSNNPTPTIDLTSMTPFYKSPGGTMIGYLGPQKLDTTGQGQTDPASGQWVEIYTWMGLAWIVVE